MQRAKQRDGQTGGVYVGYIHPDHVDAMWANDLLHLFQYYYHGPLQI